MAVELHFIMSPAPRSRFRRKDKMSSRTVKDAAGRTWTCATEQIDHRGSQLGQDVNIVCTTRSIGRVVRITVGWQWMRMKGEGLAELISSASEGAPRVADADATVSPS
jgi:hypothetical protein